MKHRAVLIDPAPRTFFGVPRARDLEMLDAQVAFLGVPYDGGTPQPGIATGRRAGPAAAREASVDQFYCPRFADPGDDHGAEGWYDVEADRDYLVGVRMADVGDVAIQGSDTQANYERITSAARGVVQRGALLVAIGGDHSISYPLGRGIEPLGEFDVVRVDAHTDALDTLDGARLTGASQLRRLAELPFVGTVAAGGPKRRPRRGRRHPSAWRALGYHSPGTRARSEHCGARDRSRDTRGCRLDRSRCARFLGRPWPLARRTGRVQLPPASRAPARSGASGRVIGFDVVELNPARDPSGMTARVATSIVTHFLSEILISHAKGGQPRSCPGAVLAQPTRSISTVLPQHFQPRSSQRHDCADLSV